ncbi:MAG TPA: Gfo/Idh/MocA family oxidoreductase [Terriglobales bacterium]|jgi:predicted dehydrogenase
MPSDTETSISVVVVGTGAFGRNHARVYHELSSSEPIRLTAIVDANEARAREGAVQFGATPFNTVEDLLDAKQRGAIDVDAASVAVPTIHHLSAATALLQAGVDVLVEKPVTATVEQAVTLEEVASRTGRIAMVGQLERFNPAVLAVRKLLTRPMFFECHRLSIFTPRSLDVDVVLDLMIHDLDVVLSMVDSPVREVRAVGLPVLTRKVDIANVRLEFENGCVANFTASRVSTERVRKVRLFQPHEYLSIDYGRQDLIRIEVDPHVLEVLANAGISGTQIPVLPSSGEGSSAGVKISKPPVEPGEPLRAELREFLRAVRTRTQPAVTLADGRRALALALDIHRSIEEHGRRAGLSG